MDTRTDIINGALDYLDEPEVRGELDSADLVGRPLQSAAVRRYAGARDALLRRRQWNWASRYEIFPAYNGPASEREAEFTTLIELPANLIKVIGVNDDPELRWARRAGEAEQAAGLLAVNAEAPVKLRYVARIDEALMPADFKEAIAAHLAVLISARASDMFATTRQQIEQSAIRLYRQAAMNDGAEGGAALTRPFSEEASPMLREAFGY